MPSTRPGSAEHQIVLHLRHELRQHPMATFYERGRLMIDFIGAVMSNDFAVISGTLPRCIVNVITVATRTGTIVALATLLRQLAGFALENNFRQLGATASLPPRVVAGIVSMLIGPALNLAGAVRDERNGTATRASRASRIAMGLLSAGALMAVASHRPAFTLGSLMGSFGLQTLTYTLMRDLLQLFFPLHDNGGMNAGGLICSSLFYGAAQGVLGVAMANLAPHSGAGYAIDEADRIAKHMAQWASDASLAAVVIQPDVVHDLLRSALNAFTEVFDDLQRPALMRWFAKPHDGLREHHDAEAIPAKSGVPPPRAQGVRIGLGRPRIGKGRWPTAGQAAEQFFTTNAMRTSYFAGVVSIALTAASALNGANLSHIDKILVVNSLVAGLVMAGYPAFIAAHGKPATAPCAASS
ncbi:hypothetical protein [Acerihabitans arboris]|uniref:Uncharacterized protein n=1 Tax=Acerihabitans arboris TaxID=2691583 RepID=A0A845SIK5_9GAMM|nr:hypothetical protein [Acerihabitans arboris]NDL61185.1 hypothetical protein [Acerihabitans arboris]